MRDTSTTYTNHHHHHHHKNLPVDKMASLDRSLICMYHREESEQFSSVVPKSRSKPIAGAFGTIAAFVAAIAADDEAAVDAVVNDPFRSMPVMSSDYSMKSMSQN